MYLALGNEEGTWEAIEDSFFSSPEFVENYLKRELFQEHLYQYDSFLIVQVHKEYDVCIKRELVES